MGKQWMCLVLRKLLFLLFSVKLYNVCFSKMPENSPNSIDRVVMIGCLLNLKFVSLKQHKQSHSKRASTAKEGWQGSLLVWQLLAVGLCREGEGTLTLWAVLRPPDNAEFLLAAFWVVRGQWLPLVELVLPLKSGSFEAGEKQKI